MNAQVAALLQAAVDVVRPLERISPSLFAEAYRVLGPGKSHLEGPWKNANAPFLIDVLDAVEEAIRTGKRGIVLKKPSQVGGSEAYAVIAIQWLLTFFPGPVLYLTAIQENAEELARDRWDGPQGAIVTCAPLAKKHLAGKKHGEKLVVKRFVDGKLVFSGLQSVNKVISNPYRFVVVDEPDSAAQFVDGDALKIAEHRTRAWAEGGPTLIIAFAHPSTPKRGVAKLYAKLSDQRRGHVACPHCGTWIAPQWEHVKVLPLEGESPAEAERIVERYHFVAPCCGTAWTEADRRAAIKVVRQTSTIPPGKHDWIGLHIWRFFSETLGTVHELAREWIESLGDEEQLRPFFNKTLGEPYEAKAVDLGVEKWRALAIPEGKDGSFAMGEIPPAAQFVTSGQDSRELELHWAAWAWGLELTALGERVLRGWLVDAGVEKGPRALDPRRGGELVAEDLQVFRSILYARTWPRQGGEAAGKPLSLARGLHDVGWQRAGPFEFCRHASVRERAIPSRGGSFTDSSSTRSPPTRVGSPEVYKVGDVERRDLAPLELNTYLLKTALSGLVDASFKDSKGVPRTRLALPYDLPDEVLEQLGSERVEVKKGRRRWVKRSNANHWWDCTVMAYAGALVVQGLREKQQTREEARVAAQARAGRRRRTSEDGGATAHAIRTEY